MAYNRKGYLLRAKKIQEIDREHYEPYHDSCHKMVWRTHIRPLYGCSYKTFLKYLKARTDEDRNPSDDNQLSLF